MKLEKIKIKHFGPIKTGTNGFIPIKNNTVFIGEQGSGKSTIVKVYSALSWLEKSLVRNNEKKYTFKDIEFIFSQQNIPSEYFNDKTEIIYEGLYYRFKIKNKYFVKERLYPLFDFYLCPKIIYIPSERNILSVVNDLHNINKLPEMLRELMYLQDEAKKSVVEFNFNSFKIKFNKETNEIFVSTKRLDNKISIYKASSGLQSITPIIYVLMHLRKELDQPVLNKIKNLNETYRSKILKQAKDDVLISKLNDYFISNISKNISVSDMKIIEKCSKHFVNQRLISIIEEPEQNLFPTSQVELLKRILESSSNETDKIIITTHSPYILSEINNLIYAYDVYNNNETKRIKSISKKMIVNPNDVSAYRIKGGKVYSIFDEENKIIDVSEIDDCSLNITNEYDSLIELN